MKDLNRRIRDHWKRCGDFKAIQADLERRGVDIETAEPTALAVNDQLHAGLQEATGEFAEWAGVQKGDRILDLGAGLGGAARFLAKTHQCRVTAVDLSPELNQAGQELTQRLGLDDRIRHRCSDYSRFDLDEKYDIIWIQHMDMQVPDKAGLYGFAATGIEPGGKVVWHDWLSGPGGPPRWPVMWSQDGSLSFLISERKFRDLLFRAGLELTRLETIAERTTVWFDRSRKGIKKILSRLTPENPSMSGRIHRLRCLLEEVETMLVNVADFRLVPFFGESMKR